MIGGARAGDGQRAAGPVGCGCNERPCRPRRVGAGGRQDGSATGASNRIRRINERTNEQWAAN